MQPRSGDGEAAPASHDQLAALCEDFPQFRIWQEIIGDRARYIACRQQPGLHPHTLITDDLAEIRAALKPARNRTLIPFSPDVPNVARMYDYFLGGKDHLQADRAAARAILRRTGSSCTARTPGCSTAFPCSARRPAPSSPL